MPKPAYTKYEGEDLDPELEIWLLGRKNKFKECHVFLHNSNEQGNKVVVSFYGDFTVNDLNGLTKAGKSF